MSFNKKNYKSPKKSKSPKNSKNYINMIETRLDYIEKSLKDLSFIMGKKYIPFDQMEEEKVLSREHYYQLFGEFVMYLVNNDLTGALNYGYFNIYSYRPGREDIKLTNEQINTIKQYLIYLMSEISPINNVEYKETTTTFYYTKNRKRITIIPTEMMTKFDICKFIKEYKGYCHLIWTNRNHGSIDYIIIGKVIGNPTAEGHINFDSSSLMEFYNNCEDYIQDFEDLPYRIPRKY